ncbi:interleukin-1 family member A [Nothobranchius furzeri]|uniref:Interleukin-1 beta n=3 Tax=Nothobranchius TaxID=28779 RepID=A0A8C6KMD6_NOTFU|nr:putative LOC107381689-like protein [Nothobranchius furzeri]
MSVNMDMKDSLVNGGVIITHQIREGKHHYEVEKVMKYKKESGRKMFVRRGDKLMEINGVDLQDLTPEEFAQRISEGIPMLTVHKPERKKGEAEPQLPGEETLQPYSKEPITLNFSWEMTREEDIEEENQTSANGGASRDESHMEEGDLLVVRMTNTSISVVSGRGCEVGTPCKGCQGTGCIFNDIIVVSEYSTVTLVPRGGGGDATFRQEKMADVLVQNVSTYRYLRGSCSENILYSSPNPERITIYYYKSSAMDKFFRGMPVVLNITGSNCFLRCCKNGTKVFLQLETCEKQKLMQISKRDEGTYSFVFYMKSDRTKQRKFESALFKGWFIHIVNTDMVEMGETDRGGDSSFLFIIQK